MYIAGWLKFRLAKWLKFHSAQVVQFLTGRDKCSYAVSRFSDYRAQKACECLKKGLEVYQALQRGME